MSDRFIIDTDVLIDFLRGLPTALAYIPSLPTRPFLSAGTVAELSAGVREGNERERLNQLVTGFRIVPISRQLAIAGGLYFRQYARSHGTGLIDAIIAATVDAGDFQLVTLNTKHFPMLSALVVSYVKP